MLAALVAAYCTISVRAAHIFSELFPLNNVPADMNMVLADSSKTPHLIRSHVAKPYTTKQFVSDIPIFELASRSNQDATKLDDSLSRDEKAVDGFSKDEGQEVTASDGATVMADASLQGECFWDGTGDGDAITLQLLCKQRKTMSECNSMRCKWIALLAIEEEEEEEEKSELEVSGTEGGRSSEQQLITDDESESEDMDIEATHSEDIDDLMDDEVPSKDSDNAIDSDSDDTLSSDITSDSDDTLSSDGTSGSDDTSTAAIESDTEDSSAIDVDLEIEESSAADIESNPEGSSVPELDSEPGDSPAANSESHSEDSTAADIESEIEDSSTAEMDSEPELEESSAADIDSEPEDSSAADSASGPEDSSVADGGSDAEDASSTDTESEGIGARKMELKDAADAERPDMISLEDPAHSVQHIYLDRIEDEESDVHSMSDSDDETEAANALDDSQQSEGAGSMVLGDSESGGVASAQSNDADQEIQDEPSDSTQSEVVSSDDTLVAAMVDEEQTSEEKWVPQLPYSESHSDSPETNEDVADRQTTHRNQRAQAVHAHDEEDEEGENQEIDLMADTKNGFISGDCVWDGTGTVDEATMTAFCNNLQERECMASDSGRKEGRCTWIGRVHAQMSASTHRDETESQDRSKRDEPMSSNARSKPTELGCVWDGSGCTGDCSVEAMTARCSQLSHAKEDCEGDEGQSQRCVWRQSLEQELLDHRVESVINFKLSVVDIVLGLFSLISVVFALTQLRQWWTNREYNEVKDGMEEVEPLLADTV